MQGNEAEQLSMQALKLIYEGKSAKWKVPRKSSPRKLENTSKGSQSEVKIFALQNTSAMGAAVTPWSSTMMMDRISLDDMPHKGRGNFIL